jgi:hypothetical protein
MVSIVCSSLWRSWIIGKCFFCPYVRESADQIRVRRDEKQVFSCFISVTIIEMNLVSIHRRNMLMCAEW